MMLVELTPIQSAALPVAAFKDHLRLGSGFSDDAVQDGILESFLRAAVAAIEARTGKVLFERQFGWTLTAWRNVDRQALPLAPVSAVTDVIAIDAVGYEESVTPAWIIEKDDHRPVLVATGSTLPRIPQNGSVRIEMVAGFGAWAHVPADLAQAVLMLAAYFYEYRHEAGMSGQELPYGVTALIEKYRIVRTIAGGRS